MGGTPLTPKLAYHWDLSNFITLVLRSPRKLSDPRWRGPACKGSGVVLQENKETPKILWGSVIRVIHVGTLKNMFPRLEAGPTVAGDRFINIESAEVLTDRRMP